MNYINELNNFRIVTSNIKIKHGPQSLWFLLMHICNRSGWKEWINASNNYISEELGCTEKTMFKWRDILIDKGFIIYKSQRRKRNSGEYKLVSMSVLLEQLSINSTVKITVDEEKSPQTTVKNTVE